MHRSGTSALTRSLSILGADLGQNLKPPVEGDNSRGFFEDWGLSRINDALLELGRNHWDTLAIDTLKGLDAGEVNALKLRALAEIETTFGAAEWFAFKDPRTCHTLPFWKDVLARAGVTPFYIIAFRNPMSVADSLAARDNLSRQRSYHLWLSHTLSALSETQGERRVFVEFDELVADPGRTLARIAASIDDPRIAIKSKELEFYSGAFLDKALHHHRRRPEHLDLDQAASAFVQDVYAMLRREAVEAQDWSPILSALAALTPQADLLECVDRERKAALREVERLSGVINVLNGEVADIKSAHEENAARHAAEIHRVVAERDAQAAEVAAYQAQLEYAHAARRAEEEAHRLQAEETAAAHKAELEEVSAARDAEARARRIQAEQAAAARELDSSSYKTQLEQISAARAADVAKLEHALEATRAADLARLEDALANARAAFELEVEALQRAAEVERHEIARVVEAQRHEFERVLEAERDELQRQAAVLETALQDRARQIEAMSERHAEALASERRAHGAELARLKQEYDALASRLRAVYASSSWRLMAPLRAVKTLVSGGQVNESAPDSPFTAVTAQHVAVSQPRGARPMMAFFTICSRNFLAFARTLHQTLREHHPDAQFFVALCDRPDPPFDASAEPFPFIYLDNLDLPEWRDMARRYNITEFNTAIKPFVIQYLMRQRVADAIVYVDPDIIVKSRLREVEDAFANGASAVLTPHVANPAENVEVSDIKMLQYGVYNLGFAAFRSTPEVEKVVAWWGRRLVHDCVIKLEEGLFVDQKWADLLPAYLPQLHVLRHPGYNVAYWNIAQRKITLENGVYKSNGEPLRFAHFSGSKLEDVTVYSRHCQQFDTTNIGDLVHLLNEYRDRVFGNGHEYYRQIPYAFSWNGESGAVNLHTPEPVSQRRAADDQAFDPIAQPMGFNGNGNGATAPRPGGAAHALRMVRTASHMAGGLPQLAIKATQILASGGFAAVKQRLRVVETASAEMELRRQVLAETPAPPMQRAAGRDSTSLVWRKKILFIDWSTPRPDRDAGSLTAFHMMEILVYLGYDVTFVPSDLEYLGAYTEALRDLGVRCLHREDISSVNTHLVKEGSGYDVAFLCRAPIAGLYIDDIRAHAPRAKILLNTSDLHFLRDMREAELSGDKARIEEAKKAKDWELNIIQRCDVSIVMSEVEREILHAEAPEADVRLLPLLFVDVDTQNAPFSMRRDIIFIGGFPHQPNVDAALYFAREIFPLVRERLPHVTWHVVGNAPPADVLALGRQPGIRVHGHVKDIAPLFRSVRLSVAPLRYGAGIKGKVGTSLAFGVPAVLTSVAAEGMEVENGVEVSVADDPVAFAQAITDLYSDEPTWTRMSEAGRVAMLNEYSVAAGRQRISALMGDIGHSYPEIEAYEVRSAGAYRNLKTYLQPRLAQRRETEISLIHADSDTFTIDGFCAVCGHDSAFNAAFLYSYDVAPDGRPIPNWREHLDCAECGLQNRLRGGVHLFQTLLRPDKNAAIYLTEQGTALYDIMRTQYPNLSGSEYLGAVCPLGEESNGLRNEDLTQLTFDDESFDFVLSFDVMEHVPDDVAAFQELFRCLKPGGRLLFAAPFSRERDNKLVRARIGDDGNVEHILPPEIHGSAVDPVNGSLCFRYFAWDVLEDLKRAGFENCRAVHYWSRDFAYLGGEHFVFIADKPRKQHALH